MLPDLVDLTHPLNGFIPIYPEDPSYSLIPHTVVKHNGYSVHRLSCGTHTGTHIDAPSHFFENGASLDQIALSTLIGPFIIVDLMGNGNQPLLHDRQVITWDEHISPALERISQQRQKDATIFIIRTGWAEAFFNSSRYYHHPYLSRDAAEHLVDRGIRVLGVDMLSPDETPYGDQGREAGFAVHKLFLGAGHVIAENLANLGSLKEQNMIALVPLKLEGSDGSPCRAFAWKV